MVQSAKVAELADALDLGSSPALRDWGFESPPSHHHDVLAPSSERV